MKNTLTNEFDNSNSDELLPEYNFDYSSSRPNRFASKSAELKVTVVLDPDVAAVFQTKEAVNNALRHLIQAMPSSSQS
jgi:hypothetical protein